MAKTDKKLVSANALLKLCRRLTGNIVLPLAFLALAAFPSRAEGINIISDDETELFLQNITKPLFKEAKIPFNRNKLYIVNDNSLNAFVADGNNLFINTGTIIAADSPDEISGVIAHEAGHITGGHIIRQKIKNQALQQASLASLLLAGTTAAVSGRADVGMAIALGSQTSLLTNYTAYRTEQERSADETAIRLLTQTRQSPEGMLAFMKKINKQNSLNGIEETLYFRTHPVTRERISFFEKSLASSPYTSQNDNLEQFKRVKAKLIAFLAAPEYTLKRYPLGDTSTAARYARAIAYFKKLDVTKALSVINGLIEEEPNNPFFRELKGQIYMETGKVHDAKLEYRKALSLLPNSALLQISLAQAVLEDNPTSEELKSVVKALNKSVINKPSSLAWMLLSRAYGSLGETAYSNYAAAEYSLRTGLVDVAEKQVDAALNSGVYSPALQIKLDDLRGRLIDLKKDRKNTYRR